MSDVLDVSVECGKYRVLQRSCGEVVILRHGEFWREETGDKLILALAQEVHRLRDHIRESMEKERE